MYDFWRDNMNVLVLGGDKRYLEIIKDFVKKDYHVDLVGYQNKIPKTNILDIKNIDVSFYDIILFPVSGVKENYIISGEFDFKIDPDFLNKSHDKALIFSGIKTPTLNEILKNSNKDAIILMQDNTVINENVIPTVEGIIADIINHTDITLKGANILVIGYGHIAKYLVEILNTLGANTIVSIKEKEDEQILSNKEIPNILSNNRNLMSEVLKNSDIIVNTAPTLVLDKNYVNYIKDDAYVLDVASYPHGIDEEALIENQIHYKIYLGIPSKVAPKTSGLILTKKINTLIGG